MKRGTSSNIKTGVTVAAGFAVAALLTNKLPFVQSNPILQIAAPIAGAIFVPTLVKGPMGKSLAAGMIAAAAINTAKTYAPGLASQMAISGVPYRSAYLPGVSGTSNGVPMGVSMG